MTSPTGEQVRIGQQGSVSDGRGGPGRQDLGRDDWQLCGNSRTRSSFECSKRLGETASESRRKNDPGCHHWPGVLRSRRNSLGPYRDCALGEAEPGPTHKVKGALLVALADVDPNDTPQPLNFGPVPKRTPAFFFNSGGQPESSYVSAERAKYIARAWGSLFCGHRRAGHVNGDSGLGDWPKGSGRCGRWQKGSERNRFGNRVNW